MNFNSIQSANSDTIAAIATPNAAGGIGIVRISGADALNVAARIFVPKSNVDILRSPGYCVYYGHFHNENGEKLDEVLCTIFRAPKSYTGEDCAEISCHGGLYITRRVLSEALAAGAKLARVGEFTERAYLNGRIALEQAEAVAVLIAAHNESALKAANTALGGALGEKITALANLIAMSSADVAAWVDYPDEDIPEPDSAGLLTLLQPAQAELAALLNHYENGRFLMEGADVVICGRPNTGKSTLMNLLCGTEHAIVTDIPGTTRDVLDATVRLGEIPLRLADTAGLRDSDSIVEQIGIKRAHERIAGSDLIFAVLDCSKPLAHDDKELLETCAGRKGVIILNKADLPQVIIADELVQYGKPIVRLCAKTGNGLDELRTVVEDLLGTADFDPNAAVLISERQRKCCAQAQANLAEAIAALQNGVTLDAAQILLDDALNALLELRGQTATEAVTAAVFSQFCVGK
ncbi:MAG: tRNA uridine-5-carboxymethylaminomethyl(34) synthesis GTPase MnmE [Oscillospiraceae bacterium]|nr:tRNA uridine-5-carboxymethylaminomethyl(34) synthesis GTPase MnmE [Oscillospiraceae bacterium]